MNEPGNGYAEPFRQLLAVSQESAAESAKHTLLLQQVVDYLKDVEGRHATSAMQTRESVRLASEQVQKSMIAELRAGDVWWKRMAWVVGIAAALSGTGTVVRIAQAMMGKP